MALRATQRRVASQGVKSRSTTADQALGRALVAVPECNVTFAGNELIRYSRADISVAVSIPGGLITRIARTPTVAACRPIARDQDLAKGQVGPSCSRASTWAAPPASPTWA